ncbi:MAG: type 4a pilus biogenesis protein PilO [Syntrophales bacterium]|nr:type 4a pilus biogenesis protein PilO [Syntrophales bacterium]
MALADDFKKLSPKMKALLVAVVFLLLGAVFWLYLLQPSLEERGALKTKLADVERQVAEQERIASQKERFIKEVKILQEAFRLALTKLPDQREIPGLFQAVSVAGKGAGMDFYLFEPKPPEKPPEKPVETKSSVKDNLKPSDQRADAKPAEDKKGPAESDKFYEEIPVKVTINGGFNNTVYFFDKVSKLPRIINIEDIVMGDSKDTAAKVRVITTSCVIKTYMFLEKKEDNTRKANEKAK